MLSRKARRREHQQQQDQGFRSRKTAGIPGIRAYCTTSKRGCKRRTETRPNSPGRRRGGTHEMTRSRDKVIDVVHVHLSSPSEAPKVHNAAAARRSHRRSRQKQIPASFLSAISPCNPARKSRTNSVPFLFFLPLDRAHRARHVGVRISEGTDLENFAPQAPRGRKRQRAGRSAAQPRFGRADSPGAPTGWAIPPDPQQPRGGEIPVQGGPWFLNRPRPT